MNTDNDTARQRRTHSEAAEKTWLFLNSKNGYLNSQVDDDIAIEHFFAQSHSKSFRKTSEETHEDTRAAGISTAIVPNPSVREEKENIRDKLDKHPGRPPKRKRDSEADIEKTPKTRHDSDRSAPDWSANLRKRLDAIESRIETLEAQGRRGGDTAVDGRLDILETKTLPHCDSCTCSGTAIRQPPQLHTTRVKTGISHNPWAKSFSPSSATTANNAPTVSLSPPAESVGSPSQQRASSEPPSEDSEAYIGAQYPEEWTEEHAQEFEEALKKLYDELPEGQKENIRRSISE
ncbi:hypothetical protein PLICRDRAFT_170461 [Plicaturopsis crispa FD-325 SS-3]|nr:hypothetical protein PLICRDRAFT_170461 [Plicaturopsis crispa FD-325 SS-3]